MATCGKSGGTIQPMRKEIKANVQPLFMKVFHLLEINSDQCRLGWLSNRLYNDDGRFDCICSYWPAHLAAACTKLTLQ